MYPENPEGTQVIVGSMNMGYISDTARNRTHNLFRSKREPIPLGHSDGLSIKSSVSVSDVPDRNRTRESRTFHHMLVVTEMATPVERYDDWMTGE